jgi:hypothetical protein
VTTPESTPLRCRLLGHRWQGAPNPTSEIGWYSGCRRCPAWKVLRAGACGPDCVVEVRGAGREAQP